MKERNGCGKYITKTLVRQVYFPEGQEVCRMCPFCIADPSNHKRERCQITGEILPFAELVIDGRCPLIGEFSTENSGGRDTESGQAEGKTVPCAR